MGPMNNVWNKTGNDDDDDDEEEEGLIITVMIEMVVEYVFENICYGTNEKRMGHNRQ